jgi:hypothetical protein
MNINNKNPMISIMLECWILQLVDIVLVLSISSKNNDTIFKMTLRDKESLMCKKRWEERIRILKWLPSQLF